MPRKKKNRRGSRPLNGLSGRLQQLGRQCWQAARQLRPRPRCPVPTSDSARRGAELAAPDLAPRGPDLILLAAALALVGLGLVMVFSSSAVFARARYGTLHHFLVRDVAYVAVGLMALYVGWRVDYRNYRRLTYPMLLGVLLLLGALLVPGIGTRIDGAVRWFRLGGVSFQPSEPAKFALVVYLAYSLAKKRSVLRSFSIGFLPHLCVAGTMALLLLKQPDLGTAAVLLTTTMLVLLVAGTRISYVLLAALAAFPLAYQQIVGTPWRMRRVLAFLDPWAYRQDAGYQVAESLISVGSGGLWGLGLGDGKQKLFFLPAAHTDFVFAIIGEELGLVGLLATIGLFVVIVVRGLRAATGARELFGTYLAYGITTLLGLQALLHMSVVLGLVPTKGITLPLVSFGGSALVTSMFVIGVLMNIAARNPMPQPVEGRGSLRQRWANRRRAQRVVVAQRPPQSPGRVESEDRSPCAC